MNDNTNASNIFNTSKSPIDNNASLEIRDSSADEIWQRMPMRLQDSHKGTYGKVLCVAGSIRYRGAAGLCVEGALRSGCGITTLATIEPVFASIQARLPECICLPCISDNLGGISAASVNEIQKELSKDYTALLMGPGMGNTISTKRLVTQLVTDINCNVVLDADALNSLTLSDAGVGSGANSDMDADAGNNAGVGVGAGVSMDAGVSSDNQAFTPDKLELLKSADIPDACPLPQPAPGFKLIITTHPGEMARLCKCTVSQIKTSRERIALAYAYANNCIVILKEHRTLIASPDGALWRNTTGNSGLARGGSGDILAGMTASLAAQGLPPLDASICAVWLHGAAAEACSQRKSQTAMLPHDIFDDLGALLLKNNR